jgi:glycosyltransferase involved in cell wall biosynthesis
MNQTFWPDNVATAQHCHDLARHLVGDGFDVSVVASRSLYGMHGSTLTRRELVDGIAVERTGRTIFGNSGLMSRSLDFAGFTALALWRALFLPRFDVVICCTTPPFLGIAGIGLRAIRGGSVLLWMMDLYPEVPVAAGLMRENSLACRFFRLVDRVCLSAADAVVVLGDRMRARVLQKGAPIRRLETIHVWADQEEVRPIPPDHNPLRAQWGFGHELVLQYSGNFGLGHESETMFRAMNELREERSVAWLFVGGGRKRAELDGFLRQGVIRNVSVRPYQAREDLSHTLCVGDIHLVTIAQGFEGVLVPSKFYGALASGRPVVYIGPRSSEIADTIQELGCGFVFECDEVDELISTIRRLSADRSLAPKLGERARAGFVSAYSREHACRLWSRLISSFTAVTSDSGVDRD